MHLASDTMTRKFPYNTIASRLATILHCMANVPNMPACYSVFNATEQSFLGNINEFPHFCPDFADTKSIARISIKTVE